MPTKEKQKEYSRKYYLKHREKRLEKQRQWHLANVEKHRESARRWYNENKERANARNKAYAESHRAEIQIARRKKYPANAAKLLAKAKKLYQKSKAARRAKLQEWRTSDPTRKLAIRLYRNALNSGELVRPSKCTRCDKDCTPDGHHSDYSKPLSVQWLCRTCHRFVHRKYA